MIRLQSKPEGSYFRYEIRAFDEDNNAFTPTTVDYRIDCVTTGQTVRDWVAVTPDTVMTITITPSDNRIFSDRNSRELRELRIRFDDGLETQFLHEPIQWYVDNVLPGRSVVP